MNLIIIIEESLIKKNRKLLKTKKRSSKAQEHFIFIHKIAIDSQYFRSLIVHFTHYKSCKCMYKVRYSN